MTRLSAEDEKELRFCSRANQVSLPGSLLREVLAELDAVRAARDALQAKASEVPGLTAALDEARWERDVAKGEKTAGSQALAELERLRAERERAHAEVGELAVLRVRIGWLRTAATQWRESARALRGEVARGVAIRQSPEEKLARAEVLESKADLIDRLLKEEP